MGVWVLWVARERVERGKVAGGGSEDWAGRGEKGSGKTRRVGWREKACWGRNRGGKIATGGKKG